MPGLSGERPFPGRVAAGWRGSWDAARLTKVQTAFNLC